MGLKLSDTRVYEPQIRVRLGTTAQGVRPRQLVDFLDPPSCSAWDVGLRLKDLLGPVTRVKKKKKKKGEPEAASRVFDPPSCQRGGTDFQRNAAWGVCSASRIGLNT